MKNLPAGCAFTVSVPFQNAQGVAVQPTGIIVTVLDEDGKVLHGPEIPTASLEKDQLVYKVPAEVNQLPAGTAIAVRTVEVELATADGAIEVRQSFLLRAGMRLRFLLNSFGTYEKLALIAADMPRLDAFEAAEQAEREPALIEAYQRLIRFGYRITPAGYDEDEVVNFDKAVGCVIRIAPREWQAMVAEDWDQFPVDFHQALWRAQVQEANAILTRNTPEEHRVSGLLSKTTGESSAMFRSGKPLDLGVARETLAHLTGFIEIRARISRS